MNHQVLRQAETAAALQRARSAEVGTLSKAVWEGVRGQQLSEEAKAVEKEVSLMHSDQRQPRSGGLLSTEYSVCGV